MYNSRRVQVTGLSVAIIFIAHVVGCLWYYAGSMNQQMEDGTVRQGGCVVCPGLGVLGHQLPPCLAS
eukprot:SAG22_NODE_1162_length_5301_cov_1.628604_5_plen_67_part_00